MLSLEAMIKSCVSVRGFCSEVMFLFKFSSKHLFLLKVFTEVLCLRSKFSPHRFKKFSPGECTFTCESFRGDFFLIYVRGYLGQTHVQIISSVTLNYWKGGPMIFYTNN